MSDQGQHAETIISRLYDGIASPEDWYGALDGLRAGIGASAFHAVAMRKADGAIVREVASLEAPPAKVREYGEYLLASGDERIAVARRLPVGTAMFDHEHIDARAMSRSGIYAEWLHGIGLRHTAALVLGEDDELLHVAGFMRGRRDPPYAVRERALCERVMHHLVRASALRERMARLAVQASISQSALHALPHGIAMLDAKCRVHHLNERAERLAAEGGVWQLSGGQWGSRDAHAAGRLQALVARACQPPPGAAAGALRVPDGRRTWTVSVLPLKAGHPLAAAWAAPLALLVVIDPAARLAAGPDAVRELLGLTPAEARLALALAEGRTVKAFAAGEGSSWHTVRTHLRSLMGKTGCHRQIELVQLVRSLGG